MVSIPDIVARGQQFKLVRQDESLRRFNGSEQIIINRVAYWSFQIPLLPRTGIDAKSWRAALTELANPAETFAAGPPGYRGAAYALAGGTATVSGAGQLGRSLVVSCAASQTIVQAGEYFSVNGELKVATATVVSSGGGTATLQFEPSLRAAPTNGATVNLLTPAASFRLAAVAPWILQPNRLHSAMIDAVESYQ